MRYFILAILILSACKKNNEPVLTGQVSYDSVVSTYFREYRIDLDKDQQFDFVILWKTIPLQYTTTTFYIKPLHSLARVNVVANSIGICRDTIAINATSNYIEITNCSQGELPDSTYQFISTPNLEMSQLAQAVFTTQTADSTLIFKRDQKWDMPAPGSTLIRVESGFFQNKQSGYLLLETNSKKFGLLIHENFQPFFIEKQVALP